jgi:hypothetical protein
MSKILVVELYDVKLYALDAMGELTGVSTLSKTARKPVS